jgi:hypothetical protein
MAAACWASFAIFAGVLVSLYGLDWYKIESRIED